MPTSQLSCVVRPFENAILLVQCQLVVRPFENSILLVECQLPCVVRPFENSIRYAQSELPCVVRPFENSILFALPITCPNPITVGRQQLSRCSSRHCLGAGDTQKKFSTCHTQVIILYATHDGHSKTNARDKVQSGTLPSILPTAARLKGENQASKDKTCHVQII